MSVPIARAIDAIIAVGRSSQTKIGIESDESLRVYVTHLSTLSLDRHRSHQSELGRSTKILTTASENACDRDRYFPIQFSRHLVR